MKFLTPVALIIIVLAGSFIFINVTQDDPFISFRYASNLAHGNGLVFNTGERVEGFSNPLWTLLMAFIIYFLPSDSHPLTILWIAKLIGILLTLASLILLYISEKARYPEQIPFASIFIALNPCVLVWSVGGLETPLVYLLISIIIYDHILKKHSIFSAIAAGLLAITRPEMPFFVLAYFLFRLKALRNTPVAAWKQAFLALAPMIIYTAFRMIYYSDIFPNTAYAKAPFQDWGFAFWYLVKGFRQFFFWWFMLPIFLLGLVAPYRIETRLPIAFAISYLLFVFAAGGDWMPGSRFFVHIAPLLAWITADGFHRLAHLFKIRESLLFGLFTLPFMIFGMLFSIDVAMREKDRRISPWPWESLSISSPVYPHYWRMAVWIKENIPSESFLATGEAGLIPYVGNVQIVDCMGLMDRHIARIPGLAVKVFDADYVLSRNPQCILLQGYIFDRRLDSDFDYCEILWNRPDFQSRYKLIHREDDLLLFTR